MILKSMTVFIKEYYSDESRDELQILDLFDNYATFLLQPLTLGMFVPCDEDGNVLREPELFGETIAHLEEWGVKQVKFTKAKEKVLFKNCRIGKFNETQAIFTKENGETFGILIHGTIEHLTHFIEDGFEFELTESAIKQIGFYEKF